MGHLRLLLFYRAIVHVSGLTLRNGSQALYNRIEFSLSSLSKQNSLKSLLHIVSHTNFMSPTCLLEISRKILKPRPVLFHSGSSWVGRVRKCLSTVCCHVEIEKLKN